MKTKRLLRAGAALVVAACLPSLIPVAAIDPDLPYNSGSTGTDGALTFKEVVNPGRRSQCMVYDSARKQMVMFGGYTDINNARFVNDTWVFNGTDWKKLNPPTSPPGRSAGMMVYDGARQEVLLFGGYRDANLNDTWVWNGVTWTQKTPTTTPNARYAAGIAYDAARSQVVMFSGNGGADETWIWDGTNWNLRTPAARPPGDTAAGMAYDAARQKVVLLHDNRQTWTWDGNNWANVSPSTSPSSRDYPGMVFVPELQEVLLYGGQDQSDTWGWNGSIWTLKTTTTNPGPRRDGMGFAYDEGRKQVMMHGGYIVNVDGNSSDTWFYTGSNWSFWSGATQTFDMSGRANGIWNFTTGDVPPGVTVTFKKNAANTPVRWLFTGDVTIRGTVAADGQFGAIGLTEGAKGGPGGFDAGLGGVRFNRSSSFAGIPGSGPGGGNAGTQRRQDGADGLHNQSGGYGNVYLQPLVGGSGGGGGGSTEDNDGGNGGGGGGAILIASSRDIVVTGRVQANGAARQHSGVSWGGRGSGGSVLIRADRISGGGTFRAVGGDDGNPNGRIRFEAFDRDYTGSTSPGITYSLPVSGQDFATPGALSIARIAGQNVKQPPTGSLTAPDVLFTQAGPIEVTVTGQGIPNGTEIRLRVTTVEGVKTAGPEILTGGSALFTLTVPAGTGTVQASADYRTSN